MHVCVSAREDISPLFSEIHTVDRQFLEDLRTTVFVYETSVILSLSRPARSRSTVRRVRSQPQPMGARDAHDHTHKTHMTRCLEASIP